MIQMLSIILLNIINLFISLVYQVDSANIIDLNQGWTITNENGSIVLINQSIPSGVYSALEDANIVESLHLGYNDIYQRWIAQDNWTYSLTFKAPDDFKKVSNIMLVFHGIDTIATILFNDQSLTQHNIQNMFIRYRYDIKDLLKEGLNTITVKIVSPIMAAQGIAKNNTFTPPECPPNKYNGECHMNFLRKMQSSFGWDWGLAAPSMGLWKPVELEMYESLIIRDVTYYAVNNPADDWSVTVKIFLEGNIINRESYEDNVIIDGLLHIDIDQLDIQIDKDIKFNYNSSGKYIENISFNIDSYKIKTWWPNGSGEQKLYTLNVKWMSKNYNIGTNVIKDLPENYLSSEKTIKIGFRTIELIEDELTNGNAFYFRINNVDLFMKGTNWIPSNILPEKLVDKFYLKHLMESVKDANMNMIRVWGGGIYESDLFYDLADEYGILIWQDMMFACAMYPNYPEFLESVREEINQNIQRIQWHPSIALWAGNNENEAAFVQNWYGTKQEYSRFYNEYIKLYDNVIKNEIDKINSNVNIWLYSSPSNGRLESGKSIIHDDPQNGHFGDVHYYNYVLDGWNPIIYPKSRFISEYGYQSFPSINAWKSIIGTNATTNRIMKQLMEHRQHFPLGSIPIIKQINLHLPLPNTIDPKYVDALIYFSQISQAMSIKAETEQYLIQRIDTNTKTMGALYWQLNDVWVAPSWSSIEFNGNYKILHYWIKKIFQQRSVICLMDQLNQLNLYAVNDQVGSPEMMTITLRLYNWEHLEYTNANTWNFTLKSNSVTFVDKFEIEKYVKPPMRLRNNTLMVFVLENRGGQIIDMNYVFPEKIKDIKSIRDPNVKIKIISSNCLSNDKRKIEFEISIISPALFVYIQIENDLITKYSLSNNGFIQLNRTETITLMFIDKNCSITLNENHIKILTVNDFFE